MTKKDAYVGNAADEKQVRKARHKEDERELQEIDDIKFILSTIAGRRFLWRYLGICGVFKSSFTGNSETYFREGQRAIGLTLINDITRVDPEAYLKMTMENRE